MSKQQHLVGVTVSDPFNAYVSKQSETLFKRIKVTTNCEKKAIELAIEFYRKRGYKVHDQNYIGICN